MRSATARSRSSPVAVVGLGLLALAALAVVTLAGLWALGIDLPFLRRPAPRPSGIPVPLTGRPIPAYTRITRDHLFSMQGEPQVRYLSTEEIQRNGFLTDPKDILGRVVVHEKAAGYAFTEKDFFPRGTRAGLVAGIPPGKRSFVLKTDKIEGLHSLRAGDHFDLLGTLPVDLEKALSRYRSPGAEPALNNQSKRASVKVLVQNGVVVMPVHIREVQLTTSVNGEKPKTKPVEEITIAVDPEEVAPLSEALAIKAEILCVARSGRPDDPGSASVTPGSAPTPTARTVETINGGHRKVVVFPGPAEGPREPEESTMQQTATKGKN